MPVMGVLLGIGQAVSETEQYPTEHLEIEQQYYGDISMELMELTHFVRQAYFQRDLVDWNNKIVSPQEVVRRYS